jgi:hypothetical protein
VVIKGKRGSGFSRFPLFAPCFGLLEFEVRSMNASVVQLHRELSTRSSPRGFGLPHVDVLIGGCVVAKAAAAGRHSLSELR